MHFFGYQVLGNVISGFLLLAGSLLIYSNGFLRRKFSAVSLIGNLIAILISLYLFSISSLLENHIAKHKQCIQQSRNYPEDSVFRVSEVKQYPDSSYNNIKIVPLNGVPMIYDGWIDSSQAIYPNQVITAKIQPSKIHPIASFQKKILADLSFVKTNNPPSCSVNIEWWYDSSPNYTSYTYDQGTYTRKTWKQAIATELTKFLADPSYASLITTMTLGRFEKLEASSKEIFTQTGTSHLLVVSGLHTGILIVIIMYLGSLGPRLNSPLKMMILPVCMLTGFLWINDFSVSVMRVWMMFVCYCLQIFLFRQAVAIVTIGIPLFISLMWHPQQLINPGFIMSYGLVLYIFILINSKKKIPFYKIQLNLSLWSIPLTAIAGLFYSPITVLANLIAVPLFSFSLPFHYLAVIDSIITNGTWLQFPSYWLNKLLIIWLHWCSSAVHGDYVLIDTLAKIIPLLSINCMIAWAIYRHLGAVPRLLCYIILLANVAVAYWSPLFLKAPYHLDNTDLALPLAMSDWEAWDAVSLEQTSGKISLVNQDGVAHSMYRQFSLQNNQIWVKYSSARARYYQYASWFKKNAIEVQPACMLEYSLMKTITNHNNPCFEVPLSRTIFDTAWYKKGMGMAK